MILGKKEFENYKPMYEQIEDEILKTRIKESLKYYIGKATMYKVAWHLFSILGILLPAAATTVVAFGEYGGIIAVMTAVTTAVAGMSALFKCKEKKKHYRTASERMKKELCIYHCKAGVYSASAKLKGLDDEKRMEKQKQMFVSRIEALIADELDKVDALDRENSSKELEKIEKEIEQLKNLFSDERKK